MGMYIATIKKSKTMKQSFILLETEKEKFLYSVVLFVDFEL